MKEKYFKIFQKVWYVNSHPVKSWEMIAQEPDAPGWYFKNLILPILIAIAVVNFFGYLFFALTIHNFSILYAFVKTIAVFFESFFTFYVTFLIIKELREKLKAEIDATKLFKLMVYAFTPFWMAIVLSGFLANYATLSSFLRFMGLYGFILFLFGMDYWKVVDPKRRTLFAFTCALTAFIIYQLINWSFSFLLEAIQFSSALMN